MDRVLYLYRKKSVHVVIYKSKVKTYQDLLLCTVGDGGNKADTAWANAGNEWIRINDIAPRFATETLHDKKPEHMIHLNGDKFLGRGDKGNGNTNTNRNV